MTGVNIEQLFEDCGAVMKGHFELRSGLHSDTYCQCARIQQRPVLESELCALLAGKLHEEYGDIIADTVIAPAMGGITIGHELARILDARYIYAEKEEGHLVLRRGFKIEKGERFIVGEDVITRGGRVQETIDIVRSEGGVVCAVMVFLNRSGGQADFGVPLISLMEMNPVTYEASECPLCENGIPLEHPGSR